MNKSGRTHTNAAEEFISRYEQSAQEDAGGAKVHVDAVASRVALWYERMRNLVDYQDEHLLRKNVIGRAMQRRSLFKDFNPNFAEQLIKEVIRAGYLPNDQVPEQKVEEVQSLINRLFALLSELQSLRILDSKKKKISSWLVEIFICAIEEAAAPPLKENFITDLMFRTIRENLSVKNNGLPERDKDVQLMIAIQRTLLKANSDRLRFHILKFFEPQWLEFSLENLILLKSSADRQMKNPHSGAFLALCRRYDTVFALIGDAAEHTQKSELRQVFSDRDKFALAIKTAYQKRYAQEKRRLGIVAFLSVISFFLSKVLIAIAIEIPFDRYIAHSFSWFATTVSILFPPVLMLVIVSALRLPSEDNANLALKEAGAVMFNEEERKYVIALPKKPTLFSVSALYFLYFLAFAATVYFITKFLFSIGFSVANTAVFYLFTSLIVATGVRLSNRARELSLEEEKGSIPLFVFDIFIMPFATFGQWLSRGIQRVNILVFIFNIFIELPVLLFIEFLENFRGFIRTRRDEIE